jgi:hypothetical protein
VFYRSYSPLSLSPLTLTSPFLSFSLRLFAFLVAPSIRIRHCLCLSGYSFFSWNAALLVSYALRVYFPYLQLPPKVGLVLFSVPCALAQVQSEHGLLVSSFASQGYVFWEYTPLAINPRHLPASWRRITDQHSRLTERVLWAIPKVPPCPSPSTFSSPPLSPPPSQLLILIIVAGK